MSAAARISAYLEKCEAVNAAGPQVSGYTDIVHGLDDVLLTRSDLRGLLEDYRESTPPWSVSVLESALEASRAEVIRLQIIIALAVADADVASLALSPDDNFLCGARSQAIDTLTILGKAVRP